MAIKINLTGVESGFEPLEPGLYAGRIKSMEVKNSKAGAPYINMAVQLNEDPERKVGKNRQVFANFSLQQQALWKLKQFLARMGVDKEELEGELEIEPSEYIGRDVVVQLDPPDAGYSMNSVKEVWGPDGPA